MERVYISDLENCYLIALLLQSPNPENYIFGFLLDVNFEGMLLAYIHDSTLIFERIAHSDHNFAIGTIQYMPDDPIEEIELPTDDILVVMLIAGWNHRKWWLEVLETILIVLATILNIFGFLGKFVWELMLLFDDHVEKGSISDGILEQT